MEREGDGLLCGPLEAIWWDLKEGRGGQSLMCWETDDSKHTITDARTGLQSLSLHRRFLGGEDNGGGL